MKLEPTEAQRKAMVDKLGEHVQWSRDGVEMAVDDMLTAANSIADGAPVGTIARRPDGAWIAWRTEDGWEYRFIGGEEPNEWPPGSNIANSWTVIYDPMEDDAPRLAEAASKPKVFREDRLDLLDPIHAHRLAQQEPPLTPRPDPTAQQEPEACESCLGSGVGLGKVLGGFLETDCSDCDATGEAQRELEDPGPPSNAHIKLTQAPRTPRVVYRLGVDEQGAEWKRRGISRDSYIWEYRFRNGVWQVRLVGNEVWASMSPGTEPTNGPFTEVLEPRVLASLAYNEAREGAVWSIVTKAGVRRLFQCQSDRWHTRLDLPGTHWTLCENFGDGPYTEVLGDPS